MAGGWIGLFERGGNSQSEIVIVVVVVVFPRGFRNLSGFVSVGFSVGAGLLRRWLVGARH